MSDKENNPHNCTICASHKPMGEMVRCYICKKLLCKTCMPELEISVRECIRCTHKIGHFCSATCRIIDTINIRDHYKSPRCIYCRGLIMRPIWYNPTKK